MPNAPYQKPTEKRTSCNARVREIPYYTHTHGRKSKSQFCRRKKAASSSYFRLSKNIKQAPPFISPSKRKTSICSPARFHAVAYKYFYAFGVPVSTRTCNARTRIHTHAH